MLAGDRIFTKDFAFGTSVNFFLMLNYYTPIVVMAVYASDVLHVSAAGGGAAAGVFVIGALVARVLCGKLIEVTGRKRMLVTGALISFLLNLLYFEAHSLTVLLLVRFAIGVAYGSAATAVGTIVTAGIPAQKRGEGLGYYLLSITLASAIGPFLGIMLHAAYGFNVIFVFCCVTAFLSFVQALMLTGDRPDPAAVFKPSDLKITDFIEMAAVPVSLVCAITYFCYSGVMAFLSPYAKEYGLTAPAGFYFIVYSLVIMASRPYTGRLFDTKGENVTMYPSFIVFALGLLILGVANGYVGVLSSAAFLGLGLGAIQSCGLAISVRLTPPDRLGLANSTFYMFVDAGVGIGPLVMGTFVGSTGYRNMFLILCGVSVLCVGLYYLIHGRSHHGVEEPAVAALNLK